MKDNEMVEPFVGFVIFIHFVLFRDILNGTIVCIRISNSVSN